MSWSRSKSTKSKSISRYRSEFSLLKSQRLEHVDLSRKGSIDDAVWDLVKYINSLLEYFTTSSCSGRIIIFENPCEASSKKGCKWLYVSHVSAIEEDVLEALHSVTAEAVFKFEPMVMHIQCHTLQDAQKLHQTAVASGFRNSGITVGNKGKIITAVRGTHGLEVPLSTHGQLLVTHKYIKFLIECANSKMAENFERIKRFYENVRCLRNESVSMKDQAIVNASENLKEKQHKINSTSPVADQAVSSLEPPTFPVVSEDSNESLSLFMFDDT